MPSIIDMWAPILPVPEIMAHIAENFPEPMLGYLRVFWKQPPSQEAIRAGAPAMARSLDDVLAAIDAAGIGPLLIAGLVEAPTPGRPFLPHHRAPPRPARRPPPAPPPPAL